MKVKFGPKNFLYRTSAVVLIAMLLLATLPAVSVGAASSALYPLTGADVNAGGGSVTWTNPASVNADDNIYATANLNNTTTHYLQATNFGFAIPAGSTINGIQLTIGRKGTTGGGTDVRDSRVSLVKAGAVQSTNKAKTGFFDDWPSSEAATSYGSSSDLWGTTWTVADINDINFGAVLSANSPNTRTASVDYFQITVTYTPPTTTVGDGTSPASKSVAGSATNKAVSAFTLTTNEGTDTVTAMTVTVAGTGLADVSAVKIYQDNGTVANEYDAGDTLKGTATYNSGTGAADFVGTLNVTTSLTQYLVTLDTVASPVNGQTMQARVTSVTASKTIVNNDSNDATLTIDVTAPTVSFINTADANPTSAGTVHWTVKFSENVTGVDTTDFALIQAGGLTGAAITTVTGSGSTYTVTATTGTLNGTLGLNIPTPPSSTIQDSAGNTLPTGFTGQVYTVTRNITISGTLNGPAGVSATVSCTSTVGTCPATVVAAANGVYSITVTMGVSASDPPGTAPYFSGTVEPIPPAAYYFRPPTTPYSHITTNQTGQNYDTYPVNFTTFYVDNRNLAACSDTTGGTLGQPFCTISKAATKAYAGDTVRVLGGTYAETVKPNFGNSTNPVTFLAGPDVVTVTGEAGNSTNGGAFRITQKHDIVINGFTITGTADYGIYAYHSQRLNIRNNHVSLSGNTAAIPAVYRVGIYLNGTTDSTISGNTTDHNSYHGIQLISGSSNNTVSNNVSFGNATVNSSRATGIDVENASSNNTVIHNITYANEDSGLNFYGGVDGGSSYNVVVGNLTYGNGDHGIDNNASPHNTIIGNTVQGNVTAGINLEGSPSGSGYATVKNNIVVDNGLNRQVGGGDVGASRGNIRADSNSITGTTFDYNLYWLSTVDAVTQIVWDGSSYANVSSFKLSHGTQEINGLDIAAILPLTAPFVSPAAIAERPASAPFNITINVGDYHLNASSSAIDSANSNDPEPALDIEGLARVDDPTIPNTGVGTRSYDDRGAYEYQPTLTTLASDNNPSVFGEAVVFTATVNKPLATGTVEFYDGTTLLGSGTLAGTPKTATYTTSALAAAALPHSITAKYLGDVNYPASTSAVLLQIVEPKPITITPNAGQSKVYGTVDPTFTYTFAPPLGLGDSLTGALGRDPGENVGTYAFTLGTLSAGPNYTLSVPAVPTFAITAISITITPTDGQSKVYGTTDPTFEYTPSLTPGVPFTGALGRVSGETVASSPYAYTLGTLSAGVNYTLSLASGHTFAITAKPITITPDDGQSKVYGAADPIFTYIPSPALESGGSFTGALGRVAGKDVNTYAYTLGTLSAGSNYSLSLASGHTFAITAKPVSITPNDGQNKVYGAADPIFTYVPSPALETGDSFTGALGRDDGADVANYAYTLGDLSAGPNYSLSLIPAHFFSITAKPITVTALSGQRKVYGAADPIFTYSVLPALEPGDSFTGALARTAGESLGAYPINLGTLSAGTNYSITFVSADFTISLKAPQTITFGPLPDRSLGEADFTVSASTNSPLTVVFTTATPSICTVTTGGLVHLVAVGTCTINADQPGDANYDPAPRVQRSFKVVSYKLFLPLIFR